MNDQIFETETTLNKPLEQVFPFFSDAKNLERLTPPWLHFKILSRSEPMGEGCLIEYALRIKGFPVRWKSEILEWNPPHSFVDKQVKGPYTKWHHTHLFEDKGDQTTMKDRVLYRAPLGLFGHLIVGRMIRRDIQTIFEYRSTMIRKIFD